MYILLTEIKQELQSTNQSVCFSDSPRAIPARPHPWHSLKRWTLLTLLLSFARSMRLRYKFADSKTTAHPFHVKSQWQPPPQPSVALETYLELTKMELAEAVFTPQSDNLSANERKALKELRTNSEINLKKADKGSTTDCHLRY